MPAESPCEPDTEATTACGPANPPDQQEQELVEPESRPELESHAPSPTKSTSPTIPSPPRKSSSPRSPDDAAEGAAALLQAETQIVPTGEDSSDDAGYDSASDFSDTVSLASSARNFMYENGRRYHGFRAGTYSFPNDDREQDREDLKHAMFLKLFDGTLHFAPLDGEVALNCLDVGTGTGIWAIDFADLFPNANVLGIDLSPIQTEWVPPNLKFMVDDAEDEWLHPPNHFDFVHTRHMVQALRRWPLFMARAFRHLKPGGYLELQEIDHFPRADDDTLAPDNYMVQYWSLVTDGLRALGLDFRIAPRLAELMRAAGFVNVVERVFWTPIGPWAKNKRLREVGLYWRAVLMEGLEAIALGPIARGLGWQKGEIDVLCAKTREAYLERGPHAFMPFYVVYGQKPEV